MQVMTYGKGESGGAQLLLRGFRRIRRTGVVTFRSVPLHVLVSCSVISQIDLWLEFRPVCSKQMVSS